MLQQNFDYYAFQIAKVTKDINKEIKFIKESKCLEYIPIKEYYDYLLVRINGKQPTNKLAQYYNYDIGCERMVLDEYCKDLDVLTFKRPWTKLKEFHKIMKIKEYVNQLTFGKDTKEKTIIKNKEYLILEISDGLKNKKFGKNKSDITYDSNKMTIESISCMNYNKKKGIYKIEWDE
jgi:hypothetical protein